MHPNRSSYKLSTKAWDIDEGEGDPILFIHGIPTSNYLWRNIIPSLTPHARCIAPDLIGMGKSDKPDIEYRLFDHIRDIEAFIQALDLKNITLGKAGRSRHMGRRPTVRGLAMSPADHPHGGGEGKSGIGMSSPKSPWGKRTLGKKTRKRNKFSNKYIVERRKRK